MESFENPQQYGDRTVEVRFVDGRKMVRGRVKTASVLHLLLDVPPLKAGQIYTADEVASITILVNDTPVDQVAMRAPTLATVRKHLAMHHGWTLQAVNGISDHQAWAAHETAHLEHNPDDLAHRHGAKTTEGETE